MPLAAVAGPFDELVDDVGCADHGAQIAGLQHDVVRGQVDVAVVLDPRERQAFTAPGPQFAQGGESVAGDDHRGARRVALPGLTRREHLASPGMPDSPQRPPRSDDHRNHAERVGERVADDGIGDLTTGDLGSELFERGRQRGRVGLRSGEEPCPRAGVEVEQRADTSDGEPDRGEEDDDGDAHPQSVLAQSTEERRTRSQTDRVDEQCQAEQRDDRREVGEIRFDRGHGEPGEQRRSGSQPDPFDPHPGERGAERDHDEQHQERIGGEHSHSCGSITRRSVARPARREHPIAPLDVTRPGGAMSERPGCGGVAHRSEGCGRGDERTPRMRGFGSSVGRGPGVLRDRWGARSLAGSSHRVPFHEPIRCTAGGSQPAISPTHPISLALAAETT